MGVATGGGVVAGGLRRRRPRPGAAGRAASAPPRPRRRQRRPSLPARRPAAGTAPPSVPTVRWSACRGGAGPQGYQCATVRCPGTRPIPAGATIAMAIDRHPATGQKIGSLLVNPGGPGVSGVDFLPDRGGQRCPPALLARFDIVGFDPPGVGRTAPITCLDGAGLARYFHTDPAPPTPAGFDALVAADRTFAAGCAGPKRRRAALREHRRRGPGHGRAAGRAGRQPARPTWASPTARLLGATYADLFPPTCGPWCSTAPSTRPLADHRRGSTGGQPSTPSCSSSLPPAPRPVLPVAAGRQPDRAFEALLAQVRANPLPAQAHVPAGRAGRLSCTAPRPPCTRRRPGPTWPQALQAASQGDGTDFLELFDQYTGRRANGSYSNLFEANAAVNCLRHARPVPGGHPGRRPGRRGGRARLRAAGPLRRGGVLGVARPGHRTVGADPGRRVAADRGGRQHRRPDHAVQLGPVAGRASWPTACCSPGWATGTPPTGSSCIRTRSTATSSPWPCRRRAPAAQAS